LALSSTAARERPSRFLKLHDRRPVVLSGSAPITRWPMASVTSTQLPGRRPTNARASQANAAASIWSGGKPAWAELRT
jgi:hypothetical protein